MRFQIERTLLSSHDRRNLGGVSTTQTDAQNLQDALTRALVQDHAELVDEVHVGEAEAVVAARQRGDLWMYRVEELRNT